jgi:hypothetical protein
MKFNFESRDDYFNLALSETYDYNQLMTAMDNTLKICIDSGYSKLLMSIIDEVAEKIVVDANDTTISKSRAISEISGSYSGLMSFTISICTSFFSFIYGLILQGNLRDTTLSINLDKLGYYI